MEETPFYIESYVSIKESSITFNGKNIFYSETKDLQLFLKEAYKARISSYPKFHKMDLLSQLALLASECILKPESHSSINKNTALIFANHASSLESDRKHQSSISDKNNYYPSPSVFVYTLPNICLGEISIKHQLHTENCFLVMPNFSPKDFLIQTNYLLKSGKAEKVLCGWVNLDANNYEAFLYLVSNTGAIKHNETEILELYTK